MSENKHVVTKDGDLELNKVEDTMDRISESRMNGILADFEEFQSYLNKRLRLAESIGLNEEQLARTAEKIAGYLSENEAPRNREEKLLQELWKVGTQEERHKLSHMLVKLARVSQ
ncbi:hypothetical protein J2T13_003518 [Paenibacillus sp. DS2015]|uniref:DUF3243 domain-containing protein n=1 Tax=Paenibacillus sp. DS2015 TaxID=3373917 RepID=UPI003D1E5D48